MGPVLPWDLVQAHPAVAVALVFLLDGLGVPLMPEVAVLLAFNLRPTFGWGAWLLALVVVMEVSASLLLYGIVRYIGIPARLERLLAGYSKTLLVNDERLLLLNRVVPVLPMSGAFVHIRRWRLGRSFLFLGAGSLAKYGLLLMVAATAYAYFQSGTALAVGLSLAGLFLAVSWTVALRRWWAGRTDDADVSQPL
ncbi:MAG: hypothetical protein ABR562_01460 [Thermoplasmatota archaeon]|nr:hypothetical protein [Halobacteriales archaeon]